MNETECRMAKLVAKDTLPIYIFIVIANSSVIIINLVVGYWIMRCKLYHIHLRMCFGNIILAMVMRLFFTCWRACRRVHITAFSSNDCDYMDDIDICMTLSKFAQTPLLTWFFSYAAITIERTISVIYTNSYEKMRHPVIVLLINALLWLTFIMDIFGNGHYLWGSVPEENKRFAAYCASTQKETQVFTISSLFSWTIPVLLAIVLSLLALQYVVWRKGMLSLSSAPRLSSRFELRTSVTALKIIVPNAGICFVSVIIMQGASVYMMLRDQSDLRNYALEKELSSAILLLFPFLFFPIATLRYSPMKINCMCIRKSAVVGTEYNRNTVDSTNSVRMTVAMWERNAPLLRTTAG